ELELSRLYVREAEFDLQQRTRETSNNVRIAYNELSNYRVLLQTQTRMVENYRVLREGEDVRFRNGESSLFLINVRERQLIDSEIKFFELVSRLNFAKNKLNWEIGRFYENDGVDN